MTDHTLTAEEHEFCRRWAIDNDPLGAFLDVFAQAREVPERFLGVLLGEMTARNEIQLEYYVQRRLAQDRAFAENALLAELEEERQAALKAGRVDTAALCTGAKAALLGFVPDGIADMSGLPEALREEYEADRALDQPSPAGSETRH